MKKIINLLLTVIVLIFSLTVPSLCAENTETEIDSNEEKVYFNDSAYLLSGLEKSEIEDKLEEISTRQNFDVVIVTVDSLNGKSAEAFADDYYDYNNYGQGENMDGCLLLISIEDRDWHISTKGYGIKVLTDAGIKYISEQFLPDLKEDNYFSTFNTFADTVDQFIDKANSGQPYDSNNLPKAPRQFSIEFVTIGVAFGVILAFLIVGHFTSQLKSVENKREASEYLVRESFEITGAYDNYIRSNVIKTPKPEKTSSGGSSTHTSSSGSSHGGGGGKF